MIHNFTKTMSQYATVTDYWRDRAKSAEKLMDDLIAILEEAQKEINRRIADDC